VVAGKTRRKPHMQIGQKGKGTGRPKPRRQPDFKTPGLPLQVGQFPANPPSVPNFLPNTAAFEHGQTLANDARAQAGQRYSTATGLIGPQMEMQKARLDTDQRVATDRLKENLAERGVYTSRDAGGNYADTPTNAGFGIGQQLYGRDIATPFGRAHQDLASRAAEAYGNASQQYAEDLLGYQQNMFDLYNQRAYDAYEMQPLSMPIGGYNLPDMPGPMMTQPIRGRTRPNRNRKPGGKKPGGRR
jgi:hypothetical protein